MESKNDSIVTGYSILRDDKGAAVFNLEIQMPRIIYNQFNNILTYYIIYFLLFGFILTVILLLYFDRVILSRLFKVMTSLSKIAENSDISKRVPVNGNDEISRLSNSINDTLESLEYSQREIQKSRVKYKKLFMNTGTATLTIDKEGLIKLVNAEFEKLSGYSKVELENNKNWMDFFKDGDLEKIQYYNNFSKIEEDNIPRNYEVKFNDRHGDVKNLYLTVSLIPGSNRGLISCLDITKRKKSEKQIKASLKEKELLIREIHHRVKNNMQIIISLLSLQSTYLEDNNIKEVFKECESRVRTMGMIHESLYQSKDLSNINMSYYINSLVSELFMTYGIHNRIHYKVNVDNISLGIDTAIPCGLLINELVTNSLKHAFPNDARGMLSIEFHEIDEDFILKISDDGIGLPENMDFKNTSTLGLNLVNTLTKQLEGTIKLGRGNKTEFIIRFAELSYEKRL